MCDKDQHRCPALGRLTSWLSSGRGYASEMLQGETWRPMTCRDRQRIHAMLQKRMARPRKATVVVQYRFGRLVIRLPASSQYRSSVLAWYMHVYIDLTPCSSAQRPRPESCCHGQAAIGCDTAQSSCRMKIGQYYWHRSDAVNRAGLSQNVVSERGKA